MPGAFDRWFDGVPVLLTGATGDFSVWYRGAPVLQLQLSVTVEIVGAGGVEVGGAADIEVVVGGAPPPPSLSGGVRISAKRQPSRPRRQWVLVGAGGVEVAPAGELAVGIAQAGRGGIVVDGAAAAAVAVSREPQGGVEIGGAAELEVVMPGRRWRERLVQQDEELVLMEVL